MTDFLRSHQMNIMMGLSSICAIIVVFAAITTSLPQKRKMILIYFESSAGLLLFFDRFAYIYRGDVSVTGYWMVRISNFMVFFLTICATQAFNFYMMDVCKNDLHLPTVPKRMIFSGILVVIGWTLIIVSQFTGFYYSFDEMNRYQRGQGFLICYAMPMLIMIIQLSVTIQYFREMSRFIRISLLLFILIPMIASIIQIFIYGLSLTNMSMVGMAIVLYIFAILDMNRIAARAIQLELDSLRQEQVKVDLALANKIQANMLPRTFPPFPNRSEFDLFAIMIPAKEVGGDFYDFFLIDDDHLALVIADVSGKGIPAAMFMMVSKNIIANIVNMGKSPGEALMDSNTAIHANNSEGMFVTVWLGVLTISTGSLVCANAGHEYPIIKRNGGEFEIFTDKHGLPVGFFGKCEYEEYELQLKAGDRLLVYTDGVTEASTEDGDMYGIDRAVEVLNQNADVTPKQMISQIQKGVEMFVNGAEQSDDLTMLALEYRGA